MGTFSATICVDVPAAKTKTRIITFSPAITRSGILQHGFIKFILTVPLFVTLALTGLAQKIPSIGIECTDQAQPSVCYARYRNENTYVPAPESFYLWKENQSARIQTATFEVTYIGFSNQAKTAFQTAVDIWSTLITSNVKIRITARWESLGAGVLGSATAGDFRRDFPGAQRWHAWYPISLAEKITGQEMNGSDADIVASFNSTNNSWYYGTSGNPPQGKFDLVSIVLHEIGHGLGINHDYSVQGDVGLVSGDFVFNYMTYLENPTKNVVTNYDQASTELKTQLTSENLYFNSPSVLAANGNSRAKIYAPSTFNPGSSIAHLDENTYKAGNPNSLMTPQIGFTEVIHNPGPIAMGMLNDMGWKTTSIQHTPITNTESVDFPFTVTCVIKSDDGYDANSVTLHYSSDGNTFQTVTMVATGVANEFSAQIPSTGTAGTYSYFISANDNAQRQIVTPGKIFEQGQPERQATFDFEAGPDTKAPKIVHDAKSFLLNTDASLVLRAVVSDNIGVQNVKVQYQVNGILKPDVTMTLQDPKQDSVYQATLNFSPLLSIGDVVRYRIVATDNSVAHNQAFAPSSSTYYEIPVVGLSATQDSYSNNFNSPTNDFFGDNLFSIQTPTGFSNGAIHTKHPYPNGSGPGNESNFIYELKVPIRVKPTDALIKFDEIVLVEPSDVGATFGSSDFFDYVIVEGSSDRGATWKKLVDGYNSREQADWLNKFNSAQDNEAQPSSTAVGDPSLYKPRQIDLLDTGNFAPGDEVVIRFSLFADQFVHGWGWAIDNLRIQIDENAPVVLHNHLDYQLKGNSVFKITTKATDSDGLAQLAVDYKVNNQPIQTNNFSLTTGTNEYTLNQTVNGLNTGDVFYYRIRAKDAAGNETIVPQNDFFSVPVIEWAAPVTEYVTDFNSGNTDFVGNFFSISKPEGFNSPLVQTTHPYLTGFGLNKSSNFTYTLKVPIVISETNPFMSYDEVAIVQPGASASADYLTVEASKDKGTTWQPISDAYNSTSNTSWNNAYVSNTNGNSSMLKNRLVNLTGKGNFKAGDTVLIRFRLFSNESTTSWGWAMDNLSIQGPVTGLEASTVPEVSLYPNPVENGKMTIEVNAPSSSLFHLSFFDSKGALLAEEDLQTSEADTKKEYDIKWLSGLYVLKIQNGDTTVTKKFVVK
jgi:hypothetical protein